MPMEVDPKEKPVFCAFCCLCLCICLFFFQDVVPTRVGQDVQQRNEVVLCFVVFLFLWLFFFTGARKCANGNCLEREEGFCGFFVVVFLFLWLFFF